MFKTPQIGKKAPPQQRGTQSAPTTVSAVASCLMIIADNKIMFI